jgi:hypothetical protein
MNNSETLVLSCAIRSLKIVTLLFATSLVSYRVDTSAFMDYLNLSGDDVCA